jgi:hypothetical protein
MAGKCGLGRKREIKSRSSLNIMTALGPGLSVAAPPVARCSRLAFRPAACLPGRRTWAGLSEPVAMQSGGLTDRRRSFSGAKGIFPCADLKKYVVAI